MKLFSSCRGSYKGKMRRIKSLERILMSLDRDLRREIRRKWFLKRILLIKGIFIRL